MNFIRRIAESGIRNEDSHLEKRSIILTNSISLILFFALVSLYIIRWKVYENLANERNLVLGAVLFLAPVVFNRLSWRISARLFLCIVPTLYLWFVFIQGMREFNVVEVTIYDGLRIYLLAVSCIPYLLISRNKIHFFIPAILPSVLSIIFFDTILGSFDVNYKYTPGSDYELMQMRFILAYGIINGSCFMMQSVILKSEAVNRCLMEKLEEKAKLIEIRNSELLESRNELHCANQQLEELLEERARKIYAQRNRILSYAQANSHYVRGPVARLMGFVELHRLDPTLDCKWLMKMVEQETKDMDKTIRRLSAEFTPLD